MTFLWWHSVEWNSSHWFIWVTVTVPSSEQVVLEKQLIAEDIENFRYVSESVRWFVLLCRFYIHYIFRFLGLVSIVNTYRNHKLPQLLSGLFSNSSWQDNLFHVSKALHLSISKGNDAKIWIPNGAVAKNEQFRLCRFPAKESTRIKWLDILTQAKASKSKKHIMEYNSVCSNPTCQGAVIQAILLINLHLI